MKRRSTEMVPVTNDVRVHDFNEERLIKLIRDESDPDRREQMERVLGLYLSGAVVIGWRAGQLIWSTVKG